jgi:hypothetical protein
LFKCCVLQEAAEVAEEGKFIANHADGRGGDCRGEAVSKLQEPAGRRSSDGSFFGSPASRLLQLKSLLIRAIRGEQRSEFSVDCDEAALGRRGCFFGIVLPEERMEHRGRVVVLSTASLRFVFFIPFCKIDWQTAPAREFLRLPAACGVLRTTTRNTAMKTLISLLAILALTLGAMQIDLQQLDAGTLFAAASTAALFALALNDGRRTSRRVTVASLARFPAPCSREVAPSSTALGLAA